MRILLAQNLLYVPSHGGANRSNRLLLEQLAARGHSCFAVAPALGQSGSATLAAFEQELAARGLAHRREGERVEFRWNGVAVRAVLARGELPAQVGRAVAECSPDVVLVTSEDPDQVVLAAVLGARRVPIVYLAHTTSALPLGRSESSDGIAALRRADGVVAVSRFLAAQLAQVGIAAEVLPFPCYGEPTQEGEGPDFARGRILLINAGVAKGLPILLGLADRFPELGFTAVASWATRAEDLAALARRPNVEVLPATDDIESLYRRARLLLVPSLWEEAFGYVAVEAQLRGIPVLAARIGGLVEAGLGSALLLPVNPLPAGSSWRPGGSAPVVPEQDLAPWAAALERLTSDRRAWQEASAAARRAAQDFVRSLSVEPFEVAFERVRAQAALASAAVVEVPPAAVEGAPVLSEAARALLALRALKRRREQALTAPAGAASELPARLRALPRVPGGRQRFPTSFAQRRLWMLWRLEPTSSAYNEAAAVRLEGRLDRAALVRSVAAIVARHEVLRSRFEEGPDGPLQVVEPTLGPVSRWLDLSALAEERAAAELARLAASESARLFDLARGPLLRATCFVLAARRHALVVVAHHIVCDGWSLGIFVRELSAFYEAFGRGVTAALPPLPCQYADYAHWQQASATAGELEAGLAAWRARLEPPAPALELPRPPRPAAASGGADAVEGTLGAELLAALRALAEGEQASLFVVLVAGWAAVLARASGALDLVIGTPIAGRRRPELGGLIGYFLNLLPLRLDLAGDPSLRELVGRARRVTFEAFEHQEVPFERLLEVLAPERDLDRTPLFQVYLNMLNLELPAELSLGGLIIEPLPLAPQAAKFDLGLYALEQGGELRLRLTFDPARFERAQVSGLLTHLCEALEQGVREPDRRLSSWLLSGVAIDRTAQPSPAVPRPDLGALEVQTTIPQRFLERVAVAPEALAVVAREARWSYARLAAEAGRVEAELRAVGVEPGARVALLFEPGAEMVAAILGALGVGAAYVPLDPAYPPARLEAFVRDAQVTAVVTCEALAERARELCPQPLPRLIFETLAAGAFTGRGAAGPEAMAYLLYTSGSTGEPKGVAQSHGGILRHMRAYTAGLRLGAADRLLLVASYAFDAAVMDIFGALTNGAALVVVDLKRRGFPGLLEAVVGEAVTVYHSTPTIYRLFAAAAGEEVRTSSLRLVVLGGEEVLASDLELLTRIAPPGCLLVNGLGPTESTLALQFFVAPGSQLSTSSVPVGFPVLETAVDLVTPAGPQRALYGTGELLITSRQLALGYWRREAETARAFSAHPAGDGQRSYRTGDLGRWLANGEIEFLGRRDTQVKVRGQRIELAEIESRLRRMPELAGAVVGALSEEGSRELRLVAWYVPVSGARIEASELSARLRAELPEAMVPSELVALERFPMTPTGKVDRLRLPRPAEPARRVLPAGKAPQGGLEQTLAGLWEQVLGCVGVTAASSFFDLGGHSLSAIQLVSRLRSTLGVEIPVRVLFEAPRLADFAVQVAGELRRAGTGEAAVPLPGPTPLARAPRAVAWAVGAEPQDPVAVGAALAGQGALAAGGAWAFPLSPAQQRLWFLEQLEPGDPAYLVARVLRLVGRLDVRALRNAFQALTARHETLRTRLVAWDGRPLQLVEASTRVPWSVIDLSGLVERRREELAHELARQEVRAPFDLERAPLLRSRLLRLAPTTHWLLATLHHLVTDGWSTQILVREITALYAHAAAGEPLSLPALPVQYGDFAVWQQAALAGPGLAPQLSYWRARLAGLPRTELPRDLPRSPGQAGRARRVGEPLPAALSQAVQATARGLAATPFLVVLTAFKLLLFRLGAGHDLSVGTPVAGRNRAEIEGLIGFFVNTLVLRTELAGATDFEDALRRVRHGALEAQAHEDLPFERLVEVLQPDRDIEVSPLFQVLFVYQGTAVSLPRFPGLAAELLDVDAGGAQFEISVRLAETESGTTVVFEGEAPGFEATTLERWLRSYRQLLAAALAEPQRPLTALPLLSAAEAHQLAVEWNDTAHSFPAAAATLPAAIAEQAARAVDRIAVEHEDSFLSYGELMRRASRLAHRLRALGIGPEAVVGVEIERSLALSVALLGVLEAGAAYLPLDASYPAERRAFMLEDAGASVLLTLAGRAAAAGPWRLDLDEEGHCRVGEPLAGRPGAVETRAGDADQPAYVLFTSGSTGRPKGVVNTHAAILNRLRWMQAHFRLGPDERVLQKTPTSFDVSVWELFWPLLVGARLVLARPDGHRDPLYLSEVLASRAVSVVHFVPSMLAAFVESVAAAGGAAGAWPALRDVVASGEALPKQLARRTAKLTGATVTNLYGPTEAAVDVTVWRYEPGPAGPAGGSVPIGRPIANIEVHVLGRHLELLALGALGELCLGGVGLARGYHRRPALTAERFVPSPVGDAPGARLYRTGDLVRRRPDGAVEFLGRLDFQVKVRGQRLELGEIEAALLAHPSVQAAVVVVRAGQAGQPRLLAYWTPTAGAPKAEEADLRHHLGRSLPEVMVPSVLVELAELPLSPAGKVDRNALPEPPEPSSSGAERRPASTETERLLAAVWCAVLQLEAVGVDDNFFQLGGDSILAIQVVARCRRAGLPLVPRLVFRHQTIAELARVLAAGRAVAVEPEPEGAGPIPLTPIQRWFLDQALEAPEHFNQAVMLELAGPSPEGLSVSARSLAAGLAAARAAHPALGARFVPQAEGWQQLPAEPGAAVPLPWIDLSALNPGAASEELERLAGRQQARLQLGSGGLLQGLGLWGADWRRLLLVAHHLVIDAVSWRVLLDDLAAGARAVEAGLPIDLGTPGSSYRAWAQRLVRFVGEPAIEPDRRFWLAEAEHANPRAWLPVDFGEGSNRTFAAERVVAELSCEETASLQAVHERGAGPGLEVAVLTALGRVLAAWSRSPSILIDVEGHGREDLFEELDLSRTVGWFTALYPLRLELAPGATFGADLMQVEARLRAIPARGLSFGVLRHLGEPDLRRRLGRLESGQVLFNYLGRLAAPGATELPFRLVEAGTAGTRAGINRRSHVLEVIAWVARGQLTVTWSFSRELHRAMTIERLAAEVSRELRGFAKGAGPFASTPLAAVELDSILEEVDFGEA